jgi:uncharacterized membrane protein YtjA (UPF0391 family)
MKPYALIFGITALVSACFTDNGIQPHLAKVGRWSLLISTVLFVITEGIVLAT